MFAQPTTETTTHTNRTCSERHASPNPDAWLFITLLHSYHTPTSTRPPFKLLHINSSYSPSCRARLRAFLASWRRRRAFLVFLEGGSPPRQKPPTPHLPPLSTPSDATQSCSGHTRASSDKLNTNVELLYVVVVVVDEI